MVQMDLLMAEYVYVIVTPSYNYKMYFFLSHNNVH